ncbi:MAG: hypothetical protein N3E47_07320, partial [Candidatus Bathyarchaeota archaeon]|nr:hypothetical protein [Candidatus Bathyarchaeota archaeon]
MIGDIFWEEVLNITLLSLRVSGISVLIGSLIGIPIGAILGLRQLRGRRVLTRSMDIVLRSIINTFMGLPPVFVGLIVYLILSSSGPLGWLRLLYTPTAM